MEVIKLPKKFRMVCYEIMDGKDGALDTRIKWQQSRQRLPISIWTMKQH